MRSLKTIKNTYLILTICSIVVGAVLLIWPQIGVNILCRVYGIFLIVYGLAKLYGY